ncbi:hypothetical protein P3G55_05690 [Leptospira sp. 96542]|nr:hypothetical protein [Leptospira sp. 96542]
MAITNTICLFDIYVNDMIRATKFYENVFNQKLEKIGDSTGETTMTRPEYSQLSLVFRTEKP